MKFFSTDQNGVTMVDPGRQERLELLESVLQDNHADYPEVYLSGDDGIVIGYRSDGCLLLEESGEFTRYMDGVDLQSAMHAWDLLIESRLEELDLLEWKGIE